MTGLICYRTQERTIKDSVYWYKKIIIVFYDILKVALDIALNA